MQVIFDTHVHTSNSFDCDAKIHDTCVFASQRGLKGFAVTDHWEVGQNRWQDFESEIRQSIADTTATRKQMKDSLLVLTGIELGQPYDNLDETACAMALCNYDYVLLSNHSVTGYPDFCDMQPRIDEVDSILEQYFTQTLGMIKTFDFDSLAHLTYPVSHFQGRIGIDVDLTKYDDVIIEILKVLVERGKSLELNTRGLRKKIGDTLPGERILTQYKKLGGTLVTIGSDAHEPQDIAADFLFALKRLAACGFSSYAYYQNRKPVMVSIDYE